jgi:hypothetical protein
MRFGALALVLALVTAPACGGGSSSDLGGSPPAIAASFTPDEPTPDPNTVAMAEGTTTYDVVTVNVTLTGTNGVYAAAFDVVYDEAHVTYLDFTHGSAFEQGGNTPNYSASAASTPGRVVVGVSRIGDSATDITGTKTIVGLQFRVKQAGAYPITIESPVMYDAQAPPQPIPGIAWFAGTLTGV